MIPVITELQKWLIKIESIVKQGKWKMREERLNLTRISVAWRGRRNSWTVLEKVLLVRRFLFNFPMNIIYMMHRYIRKREKYVVQILCVELKKNTAAAL